jgi:hypothetical protein
MNTQTRIRAIVGYTVALTCIAWVLLHLVSIFVLGPIMIVEYNLSILIVEIGIIVGGAVCLVTTMTKFTWMKQE